LGIPFHFGVPFIRCHLNSGSAPRFAKFKRLRRPEPTVTNTLAMLPKHVEDPIRTILLPSRYIGKF
jgi:hypothetical protein